MTFTQRLRPTCDEHEGCHAIECVTDIDVTNSDGQVTHPAGSVVWISHAPDSTHPECRLNPDHPAEGLTARPACDNCRRVFEPHT